MRLSSEPWKSRKSCHIGTIFSAPKLRRTTASRQSPSIVHRPLEGCQREDECSLPEWPFHTRAGSSCLDGSALISDLILWLSGRVLMTVGRCSAFHVLCPLCKVLSGLRQLVECARERRGCKFGLRHRIEPQVRWTVVVQLDYRLCSVVRDGHTEDARSRPGANRDAKFCRSEVPSFVQVSGEDEILLTAYYLARSHRQLLLPRKRTPAARLAGAV
ncbi:hypothetical protein BV20DRAFT_973037 [Pilatotrama ljubarskyi]|nr:hypothetical protein BV20DRAFT_973037 [Pilatotrama ljubarskyi]